MFICTVFVFSFIRETFINGESTFMNLYLYGSTLLIQDMGVNYRFAGFEVVYKIDGVKVISINSNI